MGCKYEDPFIRKVKEAIVEDRERIYEYHDEEISNITRQHSAHVTKSWLLGLVVGGTIGVVASSLLNLYIQSLNKVSN